MKYVDIKKTLLEDKEFMENIFKYTQKRRREEFDKMRMTEKYKTSSVKKATNDEFLERVRKIATSSLE